MVGQVDTHTLETLLEVNFKKYDAAMARYANRTEAAARKAEKAIVGSHERMRRSANRAANEMKTALAGILSAQALSQGVRIMADFGQAMSTVAAITNATGSQFDALEAKARELGATTRFSATQAAEGMLFLARAGFDTDQVLASIEGTLQLAQAGALDLGRAADIASNILTGFRLEIDETQRVVDVLALAANSANTDVNQLGEAMKFVAPVAAGLGVSLEEATAAIAELSNNGLQASLAGTGLRRVLSELESPSSVTRKRLAEMGLTVQDVQPSVVGLTNAIDLLAKNGVTTADALEMFGDRGGPAFEVLAQGTPKVKAMTAALTDAGGTAERIAKVMDDNLNGAILGLISRFQELILALGEAGAQDALIAAIKGLTGLLEFAAENADILTLAIIALSAKALMPLIVTMGTSAVAAAQRLTAQFVVLQAMSSRTTTLLGVTRGAALGLTAAMGPVTLAVGAAAAAMVLIGRSSQDAGQSLREVSDLLADYEKVQESIKSDTDALKKANDALTMAIENQGEAAQATAALEVDALQKRIAKNKELSAVYRAQAVAQLADAEAAIKAQERRLERLAGGASMGSRGGDRSVASQVAIAQERAMSGEATQLDRNLLRMVAELEEVREQATSARAAIDALNGTVGEGTVLSNRPAFSLLAPDGGGGATGGASALTGGGEAEESPIVSRIEADTNAAKQLLKSLQDAYYETFETERELIERTLQERLDAIEASTATEAEKRQARLQAELIYDKQIGDLETARAERQAEQAETEKELLYSILDERDNLLGRLEEIYEREQEMRADKIAREIEDETLKQEALLALEEIYAEKRKSLKQADTKVTEQNYDAQINAAAGFFGSLADVARASGDKQSKTLKTLFAIEKGFRIAQAALAAPAAAAKAMAEVPYPFNFAAAASVYANVLAQVASLRSQSPGFADGVIGLKGPGTGTSDSINARLSAGESVITAAGTARNREVLTMANAGIDVAAALGSRNAGGSGATVNVYNNAPNTRASERRNSDGSIDVIINAIAAEIDAGGSVLNTALERRGVSPVRSY